MTDRWLLDHDPEAGITEWYVPDEETNTFTIHTVQDVEGIVDANKEHFNQFNSVRDTFGEAIAPDAKIASIPTLIYYKLLKRYGHMRQNPGPWKRWLNDPDNAAFRTRPGAV